MRHELQRLALIPQNLRCLCHGRRRQARDDAALLHCHWTSRCNHVSLLVSKYNPANFRLKIGFVPYTLLLQMFPRELQGHKLMMIFRAPRRWQWFIGDCVIAAVARDIVAPWATFNSYRSSPIEIQTELEAIWMESASPVK